MRGSKAPPPRGARRTGRRRVLLTLGWALRLTGTAVGLTGFYFAKARFHSDQLPKITQVLWWLRLLGAVAVVGIGAYVFGVGRRWVIRGKQHTAAVVDSFDRLLGTPYVLYLRPFSDDPGMAEAPTEISGGNWGESLFLVSGLTHEEALVRRFRRFGRVIAIGRPGERLPLPGAARAYLPLDDWKDTVTGLIGGAHVVTLSAGPGPGTVWEFTEALRILAPGRLVLLVYCSPETYHRFRTAVAEEFQKRSRTEPGSPDTGRWPSLPAMPDFPSLSRPERPRWEVLLNGGRSRTNWDFRLKGLVVFGPDWTARFIRFDPTTLRLPSAWTLRRLVKRELQPVMAQLTALPTRIDAPTVGGPAS